MELTLNRGQWQAVLLVVSKLGVPLQENEFYSNRSENYLEVTQIT
jgi:hypothetical protein